jgi:hypothetical protein
MLIGQVKFIIMRTFASYSKHVEVSKQYWLSSHDYKVVITSNSYHHIMIMKLIILRLDVANKPSPMPEGVAENQINSQCCKGMNLTTWHTQAQRHHESQPFMTWPKSLVGSYLALVSSFTRMLRRTHNRWPEHYPIVHPWSMVRYRATYWHMKLLSLGIPYVPYASVHFKCLIIRTQPMRALTDTSRAYRLGALNLRSIPLSTFPSSILRFPLIALPGLQLCQLG